VASCEVALANVVLNSASRASMAIMRPKEIPSYDQAVFESGARFVFSKSPGEYEHSFLPVLALPPARA
jgi:hypothetical protein